MIMRRISKKSDGYTLVEVIVGITILTVFLTSIIFGYSSIVRMEIKKTERIYKSVKDVDEISKKYYILPQD